MAGTKNPPRLLKFILAILACYRLGTLVAEDDGPGDVFRNLRQWSDQKRIEEQKRIIPKTEWSSTSVSGRVTEQQVFLQATRGKWANIDDGLNCPYCVGVWAALLLAILVYTGIGDFVILWLGIAGGQSLLQDLRKE